MYFESDDEEYDCPLCMEELDIADTSFRPCPCGYKICRFCWHHIRENLNGRCPACRREYSDQIAEFEPISTDEISRIRREKKEKERQQKDMELANRRHLANMRVVQKNLVYIIGLHPKLATEETIRSVEYFGHFGKIAKIVINKRQIAPTSHANGSTSMQPSAAVYVTYVRKDDAAKAIHAVDGSVMAGRILRASYGTTKYCTYYLRNMTCPNPNCLYLHEPGEDADTISKEELATGKHRMRDQMANDDSEDEDSYTSSNTASTSSQLLNKEERSALPATASWGKTSTPGTPTAKNSTLPDRALTPDAFGPPLAVAVAQTQQQQQKQQLSPSVLKRKLEKKKRKELLQKQRREEEHKKKIVLVDQEPESQAQEQQEESLEYSLVNFVLGDTFHYEEDEENEPVGVSALYDDDHDNEDDEDDEDDDDEKTNQKTRSSAILLLEELNQMEKLSISNLSPSEYLTQTMPMPTYTGSFNPFTHQLLRTSSSLKDTSNTTSGPLFDSPVRKTSRFGFAQF